MPIRKSRLLSPLEQAADEARVCFATSAGCFAAGGVGALVNWLGSLDTSLPALAVVGGFYGLMGLGRWWRWSRLNAGGTETRDAGH
ncbi:MAG: hypothetical protein U0939_01760 [Pirellulales bacterium]